MTIVLWAVIYVVLGILFTEAIFNVMEREDPIRYLEIQGMYKTVYGGLTCLWLPIIVFSIIKLLLKGVFK